MLSIDHGSGHVGTTTLHAPGNGFAGSCFPFEADVSARSGTYGIDRLDPTVPVCHENQIECCKWSGCSYLRIRAEAPEFLARHGVIATNELCRVGDKFDPRRTFKDRRRTPRWDLVPIGTPELLPRLQVECRNERILLDVALHDHAILVNDRRATDSPLVVRIVKPAGTQFPKILLPKEVALEIVGVEPFGAKECHYRCPVRGWSRRRLARLWVAFRFRDSFMCYFVPNNIPALGVDCIELPSVFRHVSMRLDVSIEPVSKSLVFGLAADGSYYKHLFAPNNWTGNR